MQGNKVVHTTLTDFYLGVICIFPLATMLLDEGSVNKFLFALLIGLQLGMLFDRRVKKRTFLLLMLLAVNYVVTLSSTYFPMYNTNLLFYFPFYMVYTYFVCDNSSTVLGWFKRNKLFVAGVALVWTVAVGFSIFLPGSYYVKEGGVSYFGSFTGSIFRLGQSAMFVQVLAILMQILYRNRYGFLLNLVPMYSYFMGSSRTYLVVGLCLTLISWYLYCRKKRTFYRSLIPMALVVVLAISVTSLGEKIAHTLDEEQYGDFWFRITSSRSVIWEYTLRVWNRRESWLYKLFGASLNFTYETTGHWAHNDFVELLTSFGIVGVAQYLYSIRLLFKTAGRRVKMPIIISFCMVFVWLFNAFFNMHYVYFCAMLCYPILVMVVKYYFAEINPIEAEKKPIKTMQ